MKKVVHYTSTYGDYDGCTREYSACAVSWPSNQTKKAEEVTCLNCLEKLKTVDWHTVEDTMIEGNVIVLYNKGIEIGIIRIPLKEIIEPKGYKYVGDE